MERCGKKQSSTSFVYGKISQRVCGNLTLCLVITLSLIWMLIVFILPADLSSAIPCGETPGKRGDFVQDPVEVLDFPLLEGDTEQSKLRNSPSQMGITLKSIKTQ